MPWALITEMAVGPVRNLINCFAASGTFCVRADACSKHDVGLYLRREWADEIDAGVVRI